MREITIIIIILSIISCKDTKNREIEVSVDLQTDTLVKIDLEGSIKNFRKITLSDIADTVEYIQLETSKQSLIGKILDYKVYSDIVLVNCVNSVYVFDRSGKFQTTIGAQGKGPEEFIYADWVDYYNDTISIMSKSKILFYTKTGKYLSEISWLQSGHFSLLPNRKLAINVENIYGNLPYCLTLITSDSDSLTSFPSSGTFKTHGFAMGQMSSFEQHFYRYKSNVFYRESYNDTIYRITEDRQVKPSYFIQLGKYKIPLEHRLEYLGDLDKFLKVANNYLTYRVEESNRYLFLNYHTLSEGYGNYQSGFSIYDKVTNEIFQVGHNQFNRMKLGLYNDIDGGITFIPDATTQDGKYAYKILYPIDMKNYIESKFFTESKESESKSNFKHFIQQLKEDANPVIMIIRLKQ